MSLNVITVIWDDSPGKKSQFVFFSRNENSPECDEEKSTRKPKPVEPINPEDWPGLQELLEEFSFPLEYLNDNEWWNDLSYTCNNPSNIWLTQQFAKMHAWFKENPGRRPTTGWKRFVRYWLEKAYEYERRSNAAQK